MTTFTSIKAAREHLMAAGFAFKAFGVVAKGAEVYECGSHVAIIRKVPFAGYRVGIRLAA